MVASELSKSDEGGTGTEYAVLLAFASALLITFGTTLAPAFSSSLGGNTLGQNTVAGNTLGGATTGTQPVSITAQAANLIRPLLAADDALLVSRRSLVLRKWERMATDRYDLFRASLPLMYDEWSDVGKTDYPIEGLVLTAGDTHMGNFENALSIVDGTYYFDINDFDTVGYYPYHWDLRRLGTSLVLGLRGLDRRVSGSETNAVLDAVTDGYLDAMRSREAYVPKLKSSVRKQLFRPARKMPNRYMADAQTLHRGQVGNHRLLSMDANSFDGLDDALADYKETLPFGDYVDISSIEDAVWLQGKGVSSLPLNRVLALVTDSDGSPHVFELKELVERATSEAFATPEHGMDFADRFERRLRRSFAHAPSGADWGVTSWGDDDYIVRELLREQGGVSLNRMQDASPKKIRDLAYMQGHAVGRVHRKNRKVRRAIAGWSGADMDGFAAENRLRSLEYADHLAGEVYPEFRSWYAENVAELP